MKKNRTKFYLKVRLLYSVNSSVDFMISGILSNSVDFPQENELKGVKKGIK